MRERRRSEKRRTRGLPAMEGLPPEVKANSIAGTADQMAFIEQLVNLAAFVPMASTPADEVEAKWKRSLIEAVRSGTLGPGIREKVADDLENYYFPPKRQRGAGIRKAEAWLYKSVIKHIAEAEGISIADATLKVVEMFNLPSAEALEQRMKRARREQKAGGTKTLPKMSPDAF